MNLAGIFPGELRLPVCPLFEQKLIWRAAKIEAQKLMKNCVPTGIWHDPYVKLSGENRFRRTELFLRKKFDVHRKILSIKTPLNEKWRGYGNYFYYNFEHHFPATSFGTFREIFEEILSRIHKDSFFVKLAWTRKESGVIIVLQVEHAACI